MNNPVPTLTVRPARADDAVCLAVLSTQVYLDTYAPHGIRSTIARDALANHSVAAYEALLADPDKTILVGECEGYLVAFAVIDHAARLESRPDAAAAELARLYVQQRFTGRGVGRDLLRHAEKAAAARGADMLWLTAWAGNARALRFYPRCGYDDLGAAVYTFEGESFPNRVFGKRVRHVAPA
jgi:GNAT superfamily N-acetyltransferase